MFSSGHRSKMRWAQGECHLCVPTFVNVPGRTLAILPDVSENSHVGGLERWGVRMNDVTRILSAIERGDAKATDELLRLVYEELWLLAAQKLSHESPGQTLQATALVHEAYLRLVGDDPQRWDNRGHFFKATAEAMRRILVDSARRKKSLKRGGTLQRVELDTCCATGRGWLSGRHRCRREPEARGSPHTRHSPSCRIGRSRYREPE